MTDRPRPYDLVLYGATGFTGRLVAEYLHSPALGPRGLRWAIAGRNPTKLAAIKQELGLSVDILQADASDPASLAKMAASCRLVLTTVGPYAVHGAPLVAAAVAAGCDYVDITGEPEFVGKMIEEHHATAAQKGLRIVHCCGFDSIPYDLGTLFLLRELEVDAQTRVVTVNGYVRAGGTMFSGGTFASALEAMSRREARRRLPLLGDGSRQLRSKPERPHRDAERGGWVIPLPTIDPQIVLRTASARPDYGQAFSYGHHMVVKRLTTVVGGAAALTGMAVVAQVGAGRRWLSSLRPSGVGPTAEQLERGWFKVALVGEADGRRATVEVSGGEPGYRETSKMIAESALALLRDRDRLPPHVGVLTPGSAIGEVLIERLQRAGLRFSRIG